MHYDDLKTSNAILRSLVNPSFPPRCRSVNVNKRSSAIEYIFELM